MQFYLTGRIRCVKINSDMSEFKPISMGIAQGSVLGSVITLLFFWPVLQADLTNVTKWQDENRLLLMTINQMFC